MAKLKDVSQVIPIAQEIIDKGFVVPNADPTNSAGIGYLLPFRMVYRGFTLICRREQSGNLRGLASADIIMTWPDKRCRGTVQRGFLMRGAWNITRIVTQDGPWMRKFYEAPTTAGDYVRCETLADKFLRAVQDSDRIQAGFVASGANGQRVPHPDYSQPHTGLGLNIPGTIY